jgi:hypothetical protein
MMDKFVEFYNCSHLFNNRFSIAKRYAIKTKKRGKR